MLIDGGVELLVLPMTVMVAESPAVIVLTEGVYADTRGRRFPPEQAPQV